MHDRTRPHAGRTARAGSEEAQLGRLKRALNRQYAVERIIGQGGMATVYLAEDLRHRRKVAVKVLRSGLTSALGPDRFLQEIGFAARLQHPHILPLYDSGKANGLLFYVMPFVDGESLRHKLYEQPALPVHETLRIIRDVIDALVCAHGRNVVHRDIKPDNVMLSGRHALVMDFGVAKAVSQAGDKKALTTHGITVGTPRYMAPEQAAGDPKIDHRADIYAVGVMAYEMLAGRPPIDGDTPQATLAAQVTELPRRLHEVAPSVPWEISRIVMRCLEKRPDDRWQSASDLLAALDEVVLPSEELPTAEGLRAIARRLSRSRLAAAAAGAVVLASVSTAVPLLRGDGLPRSATARHSQLTFDGQVATAEISPNGEFLAYATDSQLRVEDLRGGTAIALEVRDLPSTSQLTTLRWSPDGSELLVTGRDPGGRGFGLTYSRLGGSPRRVSARGHAAWSADGDRVAWWYPHSPVYVSHAATGALDSIVLPAADSTGLRFHGDWSSDGKHLAIEVVVHTPSPRFQIWVVAADGTGIHRAVDEPRAVRSPRWSVRSRSIYYLQETETGVELRKIELGPDLEVAGRPRILRRGLAVSGQISLTDDGRNLALTRTRSWSEIWLATGDLGSYPVSFVTRKLSTTATTKTRARLSPDGTAVAYGEDSERGVEIVVQSLRTAEVPRRIDVGGELRSPELAWSPDARWLAAVALVRDTARVRVLDLDGRTRTLDAPDVGAEVCWASGNRLLYQQTGAKNLVLLDSTLESGRPVVSGDSLGWLSSPEVSPDGEFAAVHWNLGGRPGVRVVSLRDASHTLLLTGSRYRPVGWSGNSETVYVFNTETQAVFAVPAAGGMATEIGIIPLENADCTVREHGDDLVAACAVTRHTSDVWLVENFDPERAGSSPLLRLDH